MQLDELIMRDAASRPTTWNKDTLTVDAVIASGTPVARRDAQGEYLEILDVRGADLSALIGASVLDQHNATAGVRSVLGNVEAARVEGDEIVATLRMSSRAEIADIVRDIAAGVIKHLSVGYSVQTWKDGTQDGKRTRTAAAWTPREVSFVAVPADRNSHTRNKNMETNTTDRPSINRTIRELAARAGCATSISDGLIDRNASVEEARSAVLEDIMVRGAIKITPSNTHQSLDDPEFFRSAVADAIYTRIDPKFKPSEAASQYVGLSMVEIARACLQRAGMNTTGLGADGIVTRALSPMNTTSDYPAIMANVLNKSLRVAYEAAPAGLKDCARATTNNDFRAKMRIMLDSTGFTLEQVLEDGLYKHGSMVDMQESYAVATFGKIFGITRQVIINDDTNSMGDISRRMGIAAAQFEATQLANLLAFNSGNGPTMGTDSTPLFDAGHGNKAGTGAAPSVTTLTAARLAMRGQKGVGGGLINVVPAILVVGPDLETTAEQLITEIRPVVVGEVNPFSKLTKLVVEPRLPAYGWYLVAAPGEVDGLEYAHLAQSPGPQLESRLGFEVDGLEARVRLDWGCAFIDWRSWFYNPGH